MSGSRAGGSTLIRRCNRGGLGLDAGGGGAVGLGRAFDPFGGQPDPGQLGEQVGGGGERLGRAGAGHHLAQSR
jgi:hypothetical protein